MVPIHLAANGALIIATMMLVLWIIHLSRSQRGDRGLSARETRSDPDSWRSERLEVSPPLFLLVQNLKDLPGATGLPRSADVSAEPKTGSDDRLHRKGSARHELPLSLLVMQRSALVRVALQTSSGRRRRERALTVPMDR